MGDPSTRYARRAEPQQCCESALDAFTLAVQCGGYDVSVVRQWPRARFRRAALASVAVRPHGQEVSAPGPACNTTRHGSEASSIPGGSAVAAWPQEFTRQPPRRLTYEPPSDSVWPIVPVAGRLPARHRDFCDSGTGLRLAAPTSASADHAACGSSVDGGTIPPRSKPSSRRCVATCRPASSAGALRASARQVVSTRALTPIRPHGDRPRIVAAGPVGPSGVPGERGDEPW